MTLGRAAQAVQELGQRSGHKGHHSAHGGHHSSPCLAWLLAPGAKAGVPWLSWTSVPLPILAREGQIQLLEFPKIPKSRHESQGLLLGVPLAETASPPDVLPSPRWDLRSCLRNWSHSAVDETALSSLLCCKREVLLKNYSFLSFFFSSLEAFPVNQKIYDCFKEF